MGWLFLYLAGLCLLTSARDNGVRAAGFLAALGALLHLVFELGLVMITSIAGAVVLTACTFLAIRQAIRAGRPCGEAALGVQRDEGGELVNQAANLEYEGEWDQAIAICEAVLREPKYREHHEYARNSLHRIGEKQQMAKRVPDTRLQQ